MKRKFKQKFQMQKYSPNFALAQPGFAEATRYFVKQMRVVNFVKAHDRLHKKYGTRLGMEVELYCLHLLITVRPPCGRLFLADGYEKRLP